VGRCVNGSVGKIVRYNECRPMILLHVGVLVKKQIRIGVRLYVRKYESVWVSILSLCVCECLCVCVWVCVCVCVRVRKMKN